MPSNPVLLPPAPLAAFAFLPSPRFVFSGPALYPIAGQVRPPAVFNPEPRIKTARPVTTAGRRGAVTRAKAGCRGYEPTRGPPLPKLKTQTAMTRPCHEEVCVRLFPAASYFCPSGADIVRIRRRLLRGE